MNDDNNNNKKKKRKNNQDDLNDFIEQDRESLENQSDISDNSFIVDDEDDGDDDCSGEILAAQLENKKIKKKEKEKKKKTKEKKKNKNSSEDDDDDDDEYHYTDNAQSDRYNYVVDMMERKYKEKNTKEKKEKKAKRQSKCDNDDDDDEDLNLLLQPQQQFLPQQEQSLQPQILLQQQQEQQQASPMSEEEFSVMIASIVSLIKNKADGRVLVSTYRNALVPQRPLAQVDAAFRDAISRVAQEQFELKIRVVLAWNLDSNRCQFLLTVVPTLERADATLDRYRKTRHHLCTLTIHEVINVRVHGDFLKASAPITQFSRVMDDREAASSYLKIPATSSSHDDKRLRAQHFRGNYPRANRADIMKLTAENSTQLFHGAASNFNYPANTNRGAHVREEHVNPQPSKLLRTEVVEESTAQPTASSVVVAVAQSNVIVLSSDDDDEEANGDGSEKNRPIVL
jgi:hypothetical protein